MSGLVPISVDLTTPGRNLGYARIPHSVHRSAYGHIPVPVGSVVGRQEGPAVLLIAGNHGDEYEGQVILSDLLQTLDPEQVRGSVTFLPMANFPAAEAGMRTSPLDDGNLNRSFPGTERGSPTQMIAHFIEEQMVPGKDVVIDLHSGGSSLYCVPFGMTAWEEGDQTNDLRKAILDAFGLDGALHHEPDGDGWFSSSAAWRKGGIGFTFELGGGGTVDPKIRLGAQAGLLRALSVIGVYTGKVPEERLCEATRTFGDESLVYADDRGVLELRAFSGEDVEAGQLAALVHFPDTPGKPPVPYRFERDGYILAHRIPARVVRGDCLFHMGHEAAGD